MGLSYTSRGQTAATYESTPNSGGYYEFVNAYWPNGSLYTRWISGTPAWYYNPDGEGRVSTVTASAYQNPVTSTSYNGFSEVTAATYGSGDSDSFGYDPNTGRMTSYTYTVGGKTVKGALTWNTNGTLNTLTITDQWTPANNQTCNYGYDSLARLSSANCGSAWNQSFSYDAFGNIAKSGSQSFQPTYNYATNRYTAIGPVTPTYDANGNLTYDGFHSYQWDADGKLHELGTSTSFTYDALGRWAEKITNGNAVQSIYDPLGVKMMLATPGRTLADARIPLVGGAIAQYVNTALAMYWHPDWLGTSRLETTTSETVAADAAFAPFGEQYLPSFAFDDIWTGSAFQDTATDLWDFPYREYHPIQGRFLVPDPAGISAADPSNPQSWNRYAYVMGDPTGQVDPLGLFASAPPHMTCQQWFLQVFHMTNGAGQFCGGDQGSSGPPSPSYGPSGGGPGGGQGGGSSNILGVVKSKVCAAIPQGRTMGVNGSLGLVGGQTGSLETVVNYNSGQVSVFASGGLQVGWSGGAQASVLTGFLWGDLKGDNSGYQGGFTTVAGSATAGGGYISHSSGGERPGAHTRRRNNHRHHRRGEPDGRSGHTLLHKLHAADPTGQVLGPVPPGRHYTLCAATNVMPTVIQFSRTALALFGAGLSFVITGNLLLFVVVGEVNRKLPDNQQVQYFPWYPGKLSKVTALYSQHYP